MEAIQAIVNEAATRIKSEILQVVDGHLKHEQRRSDLKAKSEAELLESYNRRENIRIVGLPEEAEKDADNRKIPERYSTTIQKVIELAKEAGA